MAAGMSDAAFRGRRRRLLERVKRAAAEAGADVSIVAGRAVVSHCGRVYVVALDRSNMSNGETVLRPAVSTETATYSAWAWLPENRPAIDFWDALHENPPRWDVRGL